MGDRYLTVVSDDVYPLWGFKVQPEVVRDSTGMAQFEHTHARPTPA